MKKKLNKEELEKLLDEGKTHQDIADLTGYSRRTIGNWIKRFGLKSAYSRDQDRRDSIDKNKLAKEYELGATTDQLATRYGVNKSTINSWIREEGVSIRDASQSRKIYSLNEHYFDDIKTKEQSYILGFLAADGYTYGNSITGLTLSKKDEAVIDFIIDQLDITSPRRYFQRSLENERTGEYVELRVHSIILTQRLQSLGLIQNKSLSLDLESVAKLAGIANNSKLLNAFMLGYFDGDGGIYHYQSSGKTEQFSMSITGTKETCEFFKQKSSSGFIVKRHNNEANNYTFQIGGRNKVKEFLEPLYSTPPSLFFKRKYNIFTKL